jgi:hypothetical protein
MMISYQLNEYGKIVVNNNEVYYGCITDFNEKLQLVKLQIIDWRDRNSHPKNFKQMIAHVSRFTIQYEGSESQ